jgi:hypothetical protein
MVELGTGNATKQKYQMSSQALRLVPYPPLIYLRSNMTISGWAGIEVLGTSIGLFVKIKIRSYIPEF